MVSKNVNGGMVMPVSLNGTYDALLVVLDERDAGNDSFFQKEMEHIFDKRKYVYYQNMSLVQKNCGTIWKKESPGMKLFFL